MSNPKNHKKHLIELTERIARGIAALDAAMRMPETYDRGRRIGKISNYLDMANDSAMHFGLDYGWRKIGNIKRKAKEAAATYSLKQEKSEDVS